MSEKKISTLMILLCVVPVEYRTVERDNLNL
jgi:hypothetical protein